MDTVIANEVNEQLESVKSRTDITQHEIEALKTEFNLADAHTHQSQSPTQRQIVADLPAIWYQSERQTQYQSEQAFIETFYTFHGQHTALKRKEDIYLVYAASVGMHITATYLMQKQMRVGLIEPCFDNLPDLMRHMQVPMSPLDESMFFDTSKIYENLMEKAIMLDAICLVDPNNPTGFSLFADGSEAFEEVVRFCNDYNKLLILDFSFSAFILASGKKRYDVYEILENAGATYISMEDTGKTWPIQDAKVSSILCSKDINDEVYPIVTSVLLNVSPFILNIVTRYIQDSAADNFNSVSSLLDKNRDYAREVLHCDKLTFVESMIESSVAWFEINDPALTADELHAHLLKYNVYVLSGKYFYWHNADKGQRFIRLALARDSEVLFRSVDAIKEALNDLDK